MTSSLLHEIISHFTWYKNTRLGHVILPETFDTSRKRKLREAAQQTHEQEQRELARMELAYIEYKGQELESFIKRNHSVEELACRVEVEKREMIKQDHWKRLLSFRQDTLEHAAQRQVRAEIATTVPFLTFSEFGEKMQKMEKRPTKSAGLPGHPIQSSLEFIVPTSPKT